MIHSSLSEGKYPKTEICVVRVNCTIVKSGICFTQSQGGRKQIFYGGATVNSEKLIFKNSQNLLNKSPKHGGTNAPLPPQLRPPLTSHRCFNVGA